MDRLTMTGGGKREREREMCVGERGNTQQLESSHMPR